MFVIKITKSSSFDDSFHEYLFKACGKNDIQSYKSVMAQFDRVRILNLAEMNMEITVKEHKQILQAIKNKDKQISANVMENTLPGYFDMSYLKKKHPEYFKRDSLKLLTKE